MVVELGSLPKWVFTDAPSALSECYVFRSYLPVRGIFLCNLVRLNTFAI